VMRRYEPTEYEWRVIEPLLPNKPRGTQELKWYDAFNAVKQNREAEFERATLGHAIDAVSACAIAGAVVEPGSGARSVESTSDGQALSMRPKIDQPDDPFPARPYVTRADRSSSDPPPLSALLLRPSDKRAQPRSAPAQLDRGVAPRVPAVRLRS
jgi:hypothetical protein